MQRRNSNKPCSRPLTRQKSISSVKSVQLVHIHPDTAEHDAQSAATQAFARARERAPNGTAQWPPPRSSDRLSPGRQRSSPGRLQNNLMLRKQQSVRFVQPKASSGRLENGNVQDAPSRQSSAGIRANRVRTQDQTSSNASAAGMVCAAKGTAGDYISALITAEDYYTPEDDIASEPSSFRRLRKSRSMFSGSEMSGVPSLRYEQQPRGEAPQFVDSGGPFSRSHQDGGTGMRQLRTPRSTSFLQPTKKTCTFPHHDLNASAVAGLVEDTAAPVYSSIIKPGCSAFAQSRPGASDKNIRKSMRHSTISDLSWDMKPVKDGRLRVKARRVSKNFKHRLKSFFNINPDDDDAGLPPQQIKSRKSYVKPLDDREQDLEDHNPNKVDRENTTVSRVTSGIPSLHAVPSELQLRSRQGSLESLRSERKASDDRSRVTSWSNSDASTSGTINSGRGEWEKQRLSVIKENTAHLGSPSFYRPPIHAQWKVSQDDLQQSSTEFIPPTRSANGQRIYSALMKRHNGSSDANRPRPVERQHSFEDFMVQGAASRRDSCTSFSISGKSSPATIRPVVADNILRSSPSRTSSTATLLNGPRHHPNRVREGVSNGHRLLGTSASTSTLRTKETSSIALHDAAMLSTRSLASPVMGNMASPGGTLSERSSVFFSSPSYYLFRTQSPYRRAVRNSMHAVTEAPVPKSPEFNPWMEALNTVRIRCPSTCESEEEEDLKMTCAESIYSCDDVEPATNTSKRYSQVEKLAAPAKTHCDTAVSVDLPEYQIPTVKPAEHVTSLASPARLKTSRALNVSVPNQTNTPLEQAASSGQNGEGLILLRTSGHIRENAQTHSEDDFEAASQKRDSAMSSGKTMSHSHGNDNEPEIDVRTYKAENPSDSATTNERRCRKLPAVPPRSVLRPVHSTTSLGSNVAAEPMQKDYDKKQRPLLPKPLFHTRSFGALTVQDQNIATPKVKLNNKPNGPRDYMPRPPTPISSGATYRSLNKLSEAVESPARGIRASARQNESMSLHVVDENDPPAFRKPCFQRLQSTPSRQSLGGKSIGALFLDSQRRSVSEPDGEADGVSAFL